VATQEDAGRMVKLQRTDFVGLLANAAFQSLLVPRA
jgi:hypothetical protein